MSIERKERRIGGRKSIDYKDIERRKIWGLGSIKIKEGM